MKSHLFYIGSNFAIWSLHIYSFSFLIWQSHNAPAFTKKSSLGQRSGWKTSTLYCLFYTRITTSFNKQGWRSPSQYLCIIQTIGHMEQLSCPREPGWDLCPSRGDAEDCLAVICALWSHSAMFMSPGGLCCLILLIQGSHWWNLKKHDKVQQGRKVRNQTPGSACTPWQVAHSLRSPLSHEGQNGPQGASACRRLPWALCARLPPGCVPVPPRMSLN